MSNAYKAVRMGGIAQRLVLTSVGGFAKFFTSVLNNTRIHNLDTLLDLVQSRPCDTPLMTVSNHMSTLDDPLMWGIKGLPITDPKLSRWTLTAEDICFTNPLYSYLFRLGKCLPVRRGAGIYQPYMEDALDVLNKGDWLHTFPEGKLSQEEGPMRRLKWGVTSLIARASVQPIVLPIAHSGFEKVLPENYMFGRRPLLPLPFKDITIVVGEPMVFDVPQLRVTAERMVKDSTTRGASGRLTPDPLTICHRWHEESTTSVSVLALGAQVKEDLVGESPAFLEENALHWMYSHMSENLRCLLQDLALKAKHLNSLHR